MKSDVENTHLTSKTRITLTLHRSAMRYINEILTEENLYIPTVTDVYFKHYQLSLQNIHLKIINNDQHHKDSFLFKHLCFNLKAQHKLCNYRDM